MRKLLAALMLLTTATFTYAQQSTPIALYPNGVPNSKPAPGVYRERSTDSNGGIGYVTDPQLIPFFPAKDKANGTAVVICPGGGYQHLSMDKEGYKIAEKLNELGITAFVLKYRLPSDYIMVDKTIGPLQDAQRAIQMVRQNAAKWGIDPTKVGIMGFSAGGHLASTEATHYGKAVIANTDNTNLRPDFAILIYPVITMTEVSHKGSKENLLGKTPSQEMIDLYSNEKHVTKDIPPTFIVHCQDDDVVPIQNSLMFYQALTDNHVNAEIHVYQSGGHGFGLHNPRSHEDWFIDLTGWFQAKGLVK
ncbi:alpha/beta hydrolase [Mucilaginibacter jinjuensis]|uniref:Alpha/beta hydrolase n=1 Tax=Mucilaginibacter jinjuensis TaxID=1176721 RepID=A0ABY7T8T3_9SPHI|nr:alpha/beta hydrolase [Mucilaginibacter jinjuensis]WCT12899.1 alpha/beta hydrolase [Mucilaginibacter jinjuensis]